NDDFCSACGGIGRFLCCEGCPKSFHFTCTDPPFDEDNLPEGSWFCKSCYAKRHPPPIPPRGLFSELIDQLNKRNPQCFVLPREIRDRYEGVTSTDFGEYQDTEETKTRRSNRSGFVEEPDPLKLTDKNGRAILCFKCGKSALNDKKIISCDYCPLHWHLDCLDPPMSAIPLVSQRKWQCPNHIGRELIHKRRLRNSKTISVSLRRGFANDGDIEIDNDSSEEEEPGPPGSEVLVQAKHLHFMDGWKENPLIKTPLSKYVLTEEHESNGVVYRLPERGIVLDFLDRVNLLPHERRREPEKLSLTELDRLIALPYKEREFIRNAAYLNQSHTTEAMSRQALSALLDAALDVEEAAADQYIDMNDNDDDYDVDSLLAIQKIMKLKGKSALLEFLESA
ncbi:uncharacterized protein V1516DRAFT_624969, partial [Lipomyces oligophaga]|uniref:uncharacterized protein n=1 Tax=Lipomyces oligophaga TaxID=45792 RepID=UPI0034CFE2E4